MDSAVPFLSILVVVGHEVGVGAGAEFVEVQALAFAFGGGSHGRDAV